MYGETSLNAFYVVAVWGMQGNSEKIGYTPSNVKAIRYLPPAVQKDQSTHPDNIEKVFNFMSIKNAQWAVDNVEKVDEKWNSWIAQ